MNNICRIYTKEDFLELRKAGALAAYILDYVSPFIKQGISTDEINLICHEEILRHNAIPAPLNYRGYPKSVCVSLNEIVCHGISSSKKLKNGDILNIDVTVILNGWYGDTSRMYTVGKVDKKALDLIDVTYQSMMNAISIVKPGLYIGDIGYCIQTFVEAKKYSVVKDYCGHGIGRTFHEEPQVLHFGKPNTGIILKPGQVFTIEPMINIGTYKTVLLSDGWTAVTADRSLSAQFEHTIGVTDDGYEIFTLSH